MKIETKYQNLSLIQLYITRKEWVSRTNRFAIIEESSGIKVQVNKIKRKKKNWIIYSLRKKAEKIHKIETNL